MKKFLVALYLCEGGITEINFDRASIPLVRLFSGEVEARDEKFAAIQAWIDNVGTYRWDFLVRVDAPLTIRKAHIDPHVIAEMVISLPFGGYVNGCYGRTYLLDNMVERWLMCVCDPEAEEIA